MFVVIIFFIKKKNPNFKGKGHQQYNTTICHAGEMPQACDMFVRCRGPVKKIKKNYMKKNYCNPQCFQIKKLQN